MIALDLTPLEYTLGVYVPAILLIVGGWTLYQKWRSRPK